MKKVFSFLSCSVLLISFHVSAFEVKEVEIPSAAMNKSFKATVVTPYSYQELAEKDYPVVYVLHGWSGNHGAWHKVTGIAKLADQHEVIIVMPDGNFDKWYIDSPVDPEQKFETYIAKEVVGFIDNNYRTVKRKEGRAITGLSMGGFGALNIALNHQSQFGAAGSLSGGVEPANFPYNWGMKNVFGDPIDNARFWKEKGISYNAHRFIFSNIDLTIDCGVDDFFIDDNRQLHEKLLSLKIAHDYIERPGGHTWTYWDNAIKFQVLSFANGFEAKLKPK